MSYKTLWTLLAVSALILTKQCQSYEMDESINAEDKVASPEEEDMEGTDDENASPEEEDIEGSEDEDENESPEEGDMEGTEDENEAPEGMETMQISAYMGMLLDLHQNFTLITTLCPYLSTSYIYIYYYLFYIYIYIQHRCMLTQNKIYFRG